MATNSFDIYESTTTIANPAASTSVAAVGNGPAYGASSPPGSPACAGSPMYFKQEGKPNANIFNFAETESPLLSAEESAVAQLCRDAGVDNPAALNGTTLMDAINLKAGTFLSGAGIKQTTTKKHSQESTQADATPEANKRRKRDTFVPDLVYHVGGFEFSMEHMEAACGISISLFALKMADLTNLSYIAVARAMECALFLDTNTLDASCPKLRDIVMSCRSLLRRNARDADFAGRTAEISHVAQNFLVPHLLAVDNMVIEGEDPSSMPPLKFILGHEVFRLSCENGQWSVTSWYNAPTPIWNLAGESALRVAQDYVEWDPAKQGFVRSLFPKRRSSRKELRESVLLPNIGGKFSRSRFLRQQINHGPLQCAVYIGAADVGIGLLE